jgi:RNA polymerase sigma-70 factor (ECF subfamily)
MASSIDDTDGLIERARGGDSLAEAAILDGHRDRLRRLVASRLDRRLAARIDPSDVIQEALADASVRLSDYLQNPPLPLLPWLCQFALERLAKLHRHHLRTSKRSVDRERPPSEFSSQRPPWAASQHLIAGGTSPSGRAIRDEDCQRVRAAMSRLSEGDRKLLAMRHIEALSMEQIATALGIKLGAAKVRHIRALRRVQTFLEEPR